MPPSSTPTSPGTRQAAHRRKPPASYARQQSYFNALEARSGVRRVEGHFDRRRIPCLHCGKITEADRERATDVNLAAELLADAARDRYDVALLISRDSDYLSVIRDAQSLGKRVKVARLPARRSDELADAADHFVDIRLSTSCVRPSSVNQAGRGPRGAVDNDVTSGRLE